MKTIQEAMQSQTSFDVFPHSVINGKLGISSAFNDDEIANILMYNYGTRYSYLILSILYPNRDWKDCHFSEDHIFPKSEFTEAKLRKRGYDIDKIRLYQKYYNTIVNLQLLDETENKAKSATPFDSWLSTRDSNFKKRHSIPELSSYEFDKFLDFVNERRKMITNKLKAFSI